jgi:hypothetical protein
MLTVIINFLAVHSRLLAVPIKMPHEHDKPYNHTQQVAAQHDRKRRHWQMCHWRVPIRNDGQIMQAGE